MVVYFINSRLGKVLNSQKEIFRHYGSANAKKIILRLSELRAFACLADVPPTPPTRRHELIGQRKGFFAVDLKQPSRLIFKPAQDPPPLKGDGGVDLLAVTEITIVSIEDYH